MKFTIIKCCLARFSGIFALGTPSNIHGTAMSYRCAKFGAFVNSVTILTLRDLTISPTRSVLRHLVLALNHTNQLRGLFYQTMFLVAFYGFFRVGERTGKGANLKSLVHVQDLHFQFSNNVVTS